MVSVSTISLNLSLKYRATLLVYGTRGFTLPKVVYVMLLLTLLGLAVYPNCSFFNHSCAPNCVRYQDGISLKMRALYDIPQGTELAISYIEFEDDYTTRRAILNEHYFFTCQCIRCTSKDTDEAFNRIRPYMCPVKGCAGLLGINPEKGLPDHQRICSGCGHIQTEESTSKQE